MCAINGFSFRDEKLLQKMMHYCRFRGPDSEDTFYDKNFSIGHNRLSIIDPDQRSKQPFVYKNLVLSFNGEIYNYKNLRNELKEKGYSFYTDSDTEVIIKLFYEYKIEAFRKLSGIFSISIWDTNKKILYLIRDIVGVKPLYYSIKEGNIFFSSLIKPITSAIQKRINFKAFNYYNNFGYNDLRETFYLNIFKVLPGELIIYQNQKIKKEKYLKFNFKKEIYHQEIRDRIISIINKQTIADVPIALSLSGGIDSNLLLSNIKKNLRTYNLSFSYKNKKSLDSIYAKNRAKEFNSEHFEIKMNDDDFMDSLEKVSEILEEPIGNSNAIYNYILSKNIKEKVILCGDGGDEVFTGYDKYRSIFIFTILNKFNLFKFLKLNTNKKNINRLFYNSSNEMHLSFSRQNLMNNNIYFKNFDKIKVNKVFFNHFDKSNYKLNLANVMLADLDTWIPNDVLLRNDKIYMNEGVEVRVPFLDQEMIENYLFYSSFKKINIFKSTKPLLRKLFKNQLKTVLKQKKGFDSPFNFWINEEKNKSKIKYFFSPEYYKSELINYDEINKILNKKNQNDFQIYSMLMLIIFLKKNCF